MLMPGGNNLRALQRLVHKSLSANQDLLTLVSRLRRAMVARFQAERGMTAQQSKLSKRRVTIG
jgi:hypothetical protein